MNGKRKFRKYEENSEIQTALIEEKGKTLAEIQIIRQEIDALNSIYKEIYQETQEPNTASYCKTAKKRDLTPPPTDVIKELTEELEYENKNCQIIKKKFNPGKLIQLNKELDELSNAIYKESEIVDEKKERLNVINDLIAAEYEKGIDTLVKEQNEKIRILSSNLRSLKNQENELNNEYAYAVNAVSKAGRKSVKTKRLERRLKSLQFKKLTMKENLQRTKAMYDKEIEKAKLEKNEREAKKREHEERKQFSERMRKKREEEEEEKKKQEQEEEEMNQASSNEKKQTTASYAVEDSEIPVKGKSNIPSPNYGSDFEPFSSVKAREYPSPSARSQYESSSFIVTPSTTSELPSSISPEKRENAGELISPTKDQNSSHDIFSPTVCNDILSEFTPIPPKTSQRNNARTQKHTDNNEYEYEYYSDSKEE